MDEKIQGWVNLYKPKGPSSFSAIYKVKKKFNINKIGHAGTLDPNAEGILPIAINKTTKLIPFVNTSSKKYLSKARLNSKFTPKINFYLDDSFDEAEKIEKLLLNKDVLRDLDEWKNPGVGKFI